jgi:hypothetical protein
LSRSESDYAAPVREAQHWLTVPHWSSDIPLDTPHPRLASLASRGWVRLRDANPVSTDEWSSLDYVYTGGGDTGVARLTSPDGGPDSRLWRDGHAGPDKGALFTSKAQRCPTLVEHVRSAGADFGRVQVIRIEPQPRDQALIGIHRDDNNRFNPAGEGWIVRSWLELTEVEGSYMILMEQGPRGLPDPDTEQRIPLRRGARYVVDSQRLWHVVCHPATEPRYALITCYESGPALDRWIQAER